MLHHAELHDLSIAHFDCDAFYAAIEKRDNPLLADRPVIVGGGRRGVVSAACYVARLRGVRSAMPTFKAMAACPDAEVIRPNMEKYAAVGRQIRTLFESVTPLVEPLSIDEAFLDLGGTAALHGASPASTSAALVRRVEEEIGITVSVGLSFNKFLAKLASDLDKPRGFTVIGRAEARQFLADRPVSDIWGVGKAFHARLARDGIRKIGDIRHASEAELVRRYGSMGTRLWRFARAEDSRPVVPGAPAKSISAETTFDADIRSAEDLMRLLWPLCERVSERLKRKHLAAVGITLKLKTKNFRILTRSHRLAVPTQLAETLFREAVPMVQKAADGTAFRLIGVGTTGLVPADAADAPDLLDQEGIHRRRVENAIDAVRAKLGRDAIAKGRGLR